MAYDIKEKIKNDLNTYDLILLVDSDDSFSGISQVRKESSGPSG